MHPRYNLERNSILNDIAILTLTQKLDVRKSKGQVWPACLPDHRLEDKFKEKSTQFYVSGYGRVATNEEYSKSLRVVKLPYINSSNPTCLSVFDMMTNMAEIKDAIICAGYHEGEGTCTGDSGGK